MCWLLHKNADHLPNLESIAAWMTKPTVSMARLQAVGALNNFPSEKDSGDKMLEKLEGTILPVLANQGRDSTMPVGNSEQSNGKRPVVLPWYDRSRRAQGLPNLRFL